MTKAGGGLWWEAWRLSPLQGPSLPQVMPSCSAVTTVTHMVTVRLVHPSHPIKQSSCVLPLRRRHSASSSVMQCVDCKVNRRLNYCCRVGGLLSYFILSCSILIYNSLT